MRGRRESRSQRCDRRARHSDRRGAGADEYQHRATLTEPVPTEGSRFGFSVATDETGRVLVGAPGNSVGPGALLPGVAYLFQCDVGSDACEDAGDCCELLQTVESPDPDPAEMFGVVVALLAPSEDGPELVISATRETEDVAFAGAVFLCDEETGDCPTRIDNPDPDFQDRFGESLAVIDGGLRLVVGEANGDVRVGDADVTGQIHSCRLDGVCFDSREGPDAEPADLYGAGLANAGDGAFLVGAPGADHHVHDDGRAYLFRTFGADEPFVTLVATIELENAVPQAGFGETVAYRRDDAGAPLLDGLTFVGAPFREDGGAVFVFHLSRADVTQGAQRTLQPEVPAPDEQFGFSILPLQREEVVVGARLRTDALFAESGAVFRFGDLRRPVDPSRLDAPVNPTPGEGDTFGTSLAVLNSNDDVAVGAPGAEVGGHDGAGELHLFERVLCPGRDLPDYQFTFMATDPVSPLTAGEPFTVRVWYENVGGPQCEDLEPALHRIVLRDARGGPVLDERSWPDDVPAGVPPTWHDEEFILPCAAEQVEIRAELNFVEKHREGNPDDNEGFILVDVDTVDLTMRTLQLLQCDDWEWGWCVEWKEVALCMEPPFPPGRDKPCLVDEALVVELAVCNEGSAPAGPFDVDLHLNTDEVVFVGPHTFCNPIEAPVLDGVFPRIEGLDPWTPPPPEDPELCIRDPEECGCLVLRVPVHIPEIEEFMDDVGNLRLCAVADPPVFDDALAFVTSEVLECEDEYRNNSDCFRELYECENPCFFRGDCFDGGAGGGGGGAEDDPFEPGAFAPFDDCCGLFVAGPCFGALPGAPAGIPICGDPGFLELEDLIVLGELVGEVVAAEGVVAVAEGLGAILGRIDVAPLGRNLDERMRFLAETELNLLMGRERVTRRDLELTRRLFNAWDLDLRTVWFEPASSLPAGVNVTVPLGAGIVATFDDVERAGTVVPRFSQWGVRLPEGFHGPNPHFNVDIRTDARLAAGSGVTVEWDYTGLAFQEGAEVRLFHEEHGVLVDRTTESDPYLRRVVGRVGEGPTEEPITPLSRFMLLGLGAVTGIDCPEDMVLDCPADTSPDVTGVAEGSGTGAAPITVFFDDDEAPQCGGRSTILRTWTATDGFTGATCVQTIEVVDGTAPVIADLGPTDGACVWPPNHEMVCFDDIASEVSASDACGGEVEVVVTGCASSDPPTGGGDRTEPDCTLTGPADAPTGVCVRAERLGRNREGRTYDVSVEAVDACGNGASGVLSIHVPHDMRDHPGCAEAE